ncbi:MAG: histidinol dehydrogenase [Hyphomicrobiales bacterium]|nr:histidinol dehydrogenase [Hyphomicrobiales bacterium]MCY4053835.1 histidinol dehydrogenase [Hyphomicrobiales bacterium]
MSHRFDTTQKDFHSRFRKFLERQRESGGDVSRQVADILECVRLKGDTALREYTKKFDHFELPHNEAFTIPEEAIITAFEMCETETIDALQLAAERIEVFHRRQMPEDIFFTDGIGVGLGYRWKPLKSVGLYVPGGTASYPSSVLMNAIPARIAGVQRMVITTPTPRGAIQPLVLAAAHIAGVTEIYRLGGAQAIAALAFGSDSIERVDKIIGPGNIFVAEAKRQVFGKCGIDAIAGPSEIIVLAEGDNNAEWIAADLLSQAEHDTSARAILVTDNAALGNKVADAVEMQLANLPRKDIAGESWKNFGAIILVKSMEEGVEIVDLLAPEHLEVFSTNAEQIAENIHNAGAIFLGAHTPETIGDYLGGSNHVLPTNASARFASGLSTLDFLKRTSLLQCPPEALAKLAPAAITLAQAEGLDAHAQAVKLRVKKP